MKVKSMTQFIDRAMKRVHMLQRDVAYELMGEIILTHRVVTGRSRGSWHLNVNQADFTALPAAPGHYTDYPADGSAPYYRSGMTPAGTGSAPAIQKLTRPAMPAQGDIIYLTNGVFYIEDLERRYSTTENARMNIMARMPSRIAHIAAMR